MNRDRADLPNDPATLAFGPDPWAWRHHDKQEGLTWRILTREDLPRLNTIWTAMEQHLGKQDRPDQFNMPVTITLVAVDDATGQVTDAIYGECVVDFTMIGTGRRAARSVKTVIPFLSLHLFPRSIRIVRVLVPRRLARHMARLLPGFIEITDSFAQFVHKIRD